MLIPPVYAALGENVRHLLRHELDPQGQRDTDYRGTRHRSHGPKEYPVPRSQAHETLRIMTTIIMHTSDDNRGQLFLALFQGFPFLGNLPITLVFHEAPTGTQE